MVCQGKMRWKTLHTDGKAQMGLRATPQVGVLDSQALFRSPIQGAMLMQPMVCILMLSSLYSSGHKIMLLFESFFGLSTLC